MGYKILVLALPAYGHLLPLTSFINELAKEKDVKIIFYGNEEFRQLIEKTGAEYRNLEFELFNPKQNMNELRHDFPLDQMMTRYMRLADKMMPNMLKVIENEEIDLIIYDFATVYAKWFVQYLEKKYETKEMKRKPPPSVMFSPSFLMTDGVYPSQVEKDLIPKPKLTFSLIFRLIKFAFRFIYFYYKYGFKLENPIFLTIYKQAKLNLCCIMPEFHPKSHLFDKNCFFIGHCACK